ncbi:MAG: sugar ABC transporter permease [bacterium]|nr:sugar ABC transporter permease [bacterium]
MKLTQHQTLWFYLMILPSLVGFGLFTFGPMVYSFYLSFTKYNVVTPPKFIGLKNYLYLLTMDPGFWPSVKVTFIYAIVSVPLHIVISLSIALLLSANIRCIGLFRTIYFLPSLLPATASGILWIWIFNPNYGLLNKILATVGIEGPAWTLSTTWALPALIIMGLWGFGGGMIIFLAGLRNIPRTFYEAAEMDGANLFQKFINITFPMLSPVIFFNFVMGLIGAMKVFDQAYVFGAAGPGPGGPARATLFYVLYLYQKAFGHFHMGLGCAMAWMLFVAIVILTYCNFKLSKKWVFYSGE